MKVWISVDNEELAESVVQALSHDEAMKFIKQLDLAYADYDFTYNLAKYLVGELRKETKGDFDVRELVDGDK
jgi:hypothetical protein